MGAGARNGARPRAVGHRRLPGRRRIPRLVGEPGRATAPGRGADLDRDGSRRPVLPGADRSSPACGGSSWGRVKSVPTARPTPSPWPPGRRPAVALAAPADPVDAGHVARAEPGWYHADLHQHGRHSHPRAPEWDEFVARSRAAGLTCSPSSTTSRRGTGTSWAPCSGPTRTCWSGPAGRSSPTSVTPSSWARPGAWSSTATGSRTSTSGPSSGPLSTPAPSSRWPIPRRIPRPSSAATAGDASSPSTTPSTGIWSPASRS